MTAPLCARFATQERLSCVLTLDRASLLPEEATVRALAARAKFLWQQSTLLR
jgi:hypothetical protein